MVVSASVMRPAAMVHAATVVRRDSVVRRAGGVLALSTMLCLRVTRGVACLLPAVSANACACRRVVGLWGVQLGGLAGHSVQETRELVAREGQAGSLVSLGRG